jgi:Arylsulfotransferase (ASST)
VVQNRASVRARTWILLGVVALVAGCGGHSSGGRKSLPRFYSFTSRPDLKPPSVTVLTKTTGVSPGYVFFAPKKKVEQRGPLIVDNDGHVVWYEPLKQGATDFRVQQYQGKPVLTWWQGRSVVGIGHGDYVIMDDSYREIATVHAGNGLTGDEHEFQLTPTGTALITAYEPVSGDTSSAGGPKDGTILDSVLQEIDVATGRVVFEWHSIGHVSLDESYWKYRKVKGKWPPYDYFHINSIELEHDGNLLVSARNTHALYEIDHKTGKVLWRLGGKKSDFAMGKGTVFNWQHDARRLPDGDISVFDDGAFPKLEDHSRALILHQDMSGKKVTLVKAYVSPDKLLAMHQGGMQVLPDGNVFVGWGSEPYFTEFAKAGKVVFDARFGKDMDSYRAYRFRWVGHPRDRPALALRGDKAYVSWNGSTEVKKWRLVDASGKRLDEADKRDFETALKLPKNAGTVAAQALDGNGQVLGTSLGTGASG